MGKGGKGNGREDRVGGRGSAVLVSQWSKVQRVVTVVWPGTALLRGGKSSAAEEAEEALFSGRLSAASAHTGGLWARFHFLP